jgi:hypothetical protein
VLDRDHPHVRHVEHAQAAAEQPVGGGLVLAGEEPETAQSPVVELVVLDDVDEAGVGGDPHRVDRHPARERDQPARKRHRAHQQVTLGEAQPVPGAHQRATIGHHAVLVGGEAGKAWHQAEEG